MGETTDLCGKVRQMGRQVYKQTPSLYQRSDINMQELEIPWLSLFICGFASQNKKVKSVRFGDMVRTKSNTQTTNLLRLVQSQEPTLTLR